MRQPLYFMNASELGETATEVEESLEQVLELASKWNAILLLDECDMFLKARSTADMRRNCLVSGEFATAPFSCKMMLPS
jgi:2-methylaconitate cis-trans-isomerase PrpF